MNTVQQDNITYYEVNGELWRNKRNAHQAEQEVVPYQDRRFIVESINQVFEPLYIEGALLLMKASKVKAFVLLKRGDYQRPSALPTGWSIEEKQYKKIEFHYPLNSTYTVIADEHGQLWLMLQTNTIKDAPNDQDVP